MWSPPVGGSVGSGASGVGGARPAPPSSGNACVGGGCRGAEVGARAVSRTRVRVLVWRWGLRSVSPSPSLPEARTSLRGLSPPRSTPRGVRVARRPPPLLLHLSPREGVARVHGGSVLFLRFSPGVGRRPVSRRSPLAWSLLARSRSSDPARRGSGVPRFPDVAPRLPCALGVGPLRPPPAREPRPHPPARSRPVRSAACASCWERGLLAAARYGCVAGFRRVAFPVPPPPSPRPSVPLLATSVVWGGERFRRSRGPTVAGRFSLHLPPGSYPPLAPRPVWPASRLFPMPRWEEGREGEGE